MPGGSNYAYIDAQNLNLGMRTLGWKLNLRRFRSYLEQMFHVVKAYIFFGYISENQELYDAFRKAGFILMFKPLRPATDGTIKGNIDADLVLQAMIDYPEYHRAVIVTSDGDFHGLVAYLYNTNKLETVISPNRYKCSNLLVQAARERITFLNELERQLAYRKVRPLKPQGKPALGTGAAGIDPGLTTEDLI